MSSPEPHAIPFRTLLTEQLRLTGFALTREAVLAGAALAFVCVFSIAMAVRYDDRLYFTPELLLATLFAAPLLPFALWKGDKVFDRAFIWTLPVARQRAALAKVLAGAVWLMLAMLITFAALSLVALLSGGGIGESRVRLLQVGADVVQARWGTPAWMWLMSFVGALILYFLGSALLLGLRHPLRWLAGTGVVIGTLIATIINLSPEGAIAQGLEHARIWLITGPIGIDWVLSGGEDSLSDWRPGRNDRYIQVWRAMPAIGGWAFAAGTWLLVSLAALALALRRHWER